MSNMARTVVIVPTYNERENLPRLVETVMALPISDLTLLIVDDNSPDGTGKLADELSVSSGERVQVLHRPGKQGLGRAYIHGFKTALAAGAERLVQMDADFSHDPHDIPRLLEALENADMVIGSRYVKGGRLDETWGVWRRLLSWWANRVWVNLILQTHVMDSTGGFRAWRRGPLLGMNLDQIQSNGYIFQVEITHITLKLGYRVCEVPIYFAERKEGESKMGLSVQIEAALGAFRLRWHYRHVTPADRAPGG